MPAMGERRITIMKTWSQELIEKMKIHAGEPEWNRVNTQNPFAVARWGVVTTRMVEILMNAPEPYGPPTTMAELVIGVGGKSLTIFAAIEDMPDNGKD